MFVRVFQLASTCFHFTENRRSGPFIPNISTLNIHSITKNFFLNLYRNNQKCRDEIQHNENIKKADIRYNK